MIWNAKVNKTTKEPGGAAEEDGADAATRTKDPETVPTGPDNG